MADDRKAPDEPFLQRWARRKTEAATAEPAPAEPAPAQPEIETESPTDAADVPARAEDAAEESEIDLAALPDVDSLDETSDFSIFMRDGIPEELRTRALQRLWRLDPSFGHIDGLLEYGEDFAGTGLAAEAVNSIYKVGKGMLSEETETTAADAAAPPDDAEGETATAPPRPEDDADADTPSDDTVDDPERTG